MLRKLESSMCMRQLSIAGLRESISREDSPWSTCPHLSLNTSLCQIDSDSAPRRSSKNSQR